MSNFDIWYNNYSSESTTVECIAGDGSTGLYKTQSNYLIDDLYRDVPTYHVWIHGIWLTGTTDLEYAKKVWKEKGGTL